MWRYAVHVLLLAALFGRHLLPLVASTRRPLMQIVRSLTMVVMPTSFAVAIGHGASAELVWSVFWIAPLLIISLEVVLLNARPAPVAWVASAVGAVAAAALFGNGAVPQRATATLRRALIRRLRRDNARILLLSLLTCSLRPARLWPSLPR